MIIELPGQMTGTVTAVSGTACTVDVLGPDGTAAIPSSFPAGSVVVGSYVVLFPVNSTWYVNAVLPASS